jgi:ATPase subunit of ABC transporter with duplicated ATPase domains
MRVHLAGVGKSYGAQLILDQVTLTIGPHARIGLVGPNGVGKSTLLRVVAGLERPDSGVVARSPQSLTVGYLEQERTLGG